MECILKNFASASCFKFYFNVISVFLLVVRRRVWPQVRLL